jgi:hypothetical protein
MNKIPDLDQNDGFDGGSTAISPRILWLAQYGPRPVTPRNWPSAWLWQFTGDGLGPKPHSLPGIVGFGIDINSYEGDAMKLAADWSGPITVEPPTVKGGLSLAIGETSDIAAGLGEALHEATADGIV